MRIHPNCYECRNLEEPERLVSQCGVVLIYSCSVKQDLRIGSPENTACGAFSKKEVSKD